MPKNQGEDNHKLRVYSVRIKFMLVFGIRAGFDGQQEEQVPPGVGCSPLEHRCKHHVELEAFLPQSSPGQQSFVFALFGERDV